MSVAQTQRTIVKVYEYDPDFKKKALNIISIYMISKNLYMGTY